MTFNRLIALALLVFFTGVICVLLGTPNLNHSKVALAAGPTSNATIIFTGTTAGTQPNYTLTTTPGGFKTTDQYIVRAKVHATNSGATTLNVDSTGAKAVQKQNDSGLFALAGGELLINTQYDFVFQSACNCYVVTTIPASGTTIGASSTTVSQQQWANGHLFVFNNSGQTLTFPQASTLTPFGIIVVQTVGVTVTIAPNAADGINGGALNTSVNVPANYTTFISSSGVSGANGLTVPLGRIIPLPLTYAVGTNPNNLALSNISQPYTIVGIRCTPEISETGSATITVVKAASGTALSAGTALHSGTCNAASPSIGSDQNLIVTVSVLNPGDRVGLQTSGFPASPPGAGIVTVFVQ